jgi:uncharacterized RmlC-like cupin family protein
MISPFAPVSLESNFFKIAKHQELAERLQDFFKDPKNNYLWGIHVHRQLAAVELKYTKSINLRVPRPPSMIKTTHEYNQVMDIVDFKLKNEIAIFLELCNWIDLTLNSVGAKKVTLGRIFFSKLAAQQQVDTHIDQGAYFDYYDRFHFIVNAEHNEFIVRDDHLSFDDGDFYWINNHVPHSLINNSTNERIIVIVDARLE